MRPTARRWCWPPIRRRSTTALPFLNVTGCSIRCRCRSPTSWTKRRISACCCSRISATSRCRRISGCASSEEHGKLYREAVRLIAALQHRGAELASDDYLPYGIAFDEAKLGWEMEFFLKHYLLGLSRRRSRRGHADGDPHRTAAAGGAARRRAARAVPSRLPQPQPDAAQAAAAPDRLPGRAPRPRHLRPGLAAARLLRRPVGFDGELAARVLPRAHAAGPRPRRSSASAST